MRRAVHHPLHQLLIHAPHKQHAARCRSEVRRTQQPTTQLHLGECAQSNLRHMVLMLMQYAPADVLLHPAIIKYLFTNDYGKIRDGADALIDKATANMDRTTIYICF